MAEALKAAGNELFKANKFAEAAEQYSAALAAATEDQVELKTMLFANSMSGCCLFVCLLLCVANKCLVRSVLQSQD
jgi:hypothetical protein